MKALTSALKIAVKANSELLVQNMKKALFIGESNFSYTLEVLKEKHSLKNHVVYTTSLESEEVVKATYRDAGPILKQLKLHDGVHIHHGVDATKFAHHPMIKTSRYDLIQFNFPHYPVDPSDKKLHMHLLFNFFLQSSYVLKNNGVVKVLLQGNEPYHSWELEKIAQGCRFKLANFEGFNRNNYELYKPKKGWGKCPDADLNIKKAYFYEFQLENEQEVK